MNKNQENLQNNVNHYNQFYSKIDIQEHVNLSLNVKKELKRIKKRHSAQHLLFDEYFIESLEGKKVFEIGAGTCFNALIMALLNAEVTVYDTSDETQNWVNKINETIPLKNPIKCLVGDPDEIKISYSK